MRWPPCLRPLSPRKLPTGWSALHSLIRVSVDFRAAGAGRPARGRTRVRLRVRLRLRTGGTSNVWHVHDVNPGLGGTSRSGDVLSSLPVNRVLFPMLTIEDEENVTRPRGDHKSMAGVRCTAESGSQKNRFCAIPLHTPEAPRTRQERRTRCSSEQVPCSIHRGSTPW